MAFKARLLGGQIICLLLLEALCVISFMTINPSVETGKLRHKTMSDICKGQAAISGRAVFGSQSAQLLGPVRAPDASQGGGMLSLKVTAVLKGAGCRRLRKT